jgi:predicted HTH transcriptional regulator
LENIFIIYDDILDIKNTGDFINGMKKIKLENNNKFNKNYFIIL